MDAPADTTGKLIDKKSANEFNQELEHDIEDHRMTMALIGQFEKAGKASCRSRRFKRASDIPPLWRKDRRPACLLARAVDKILLVSGLRRPAVQAQIVAAGGFKALVPKDLLDVTNRTAIEKQLGRRSVPQ